MRLMSMTYPAIALVTYAVVAGTPTFAPAEGTTLVKTIETTAKLESTSISIAFDDEEHSGDELGNPSMSFDAGSKYVITDEYVKMGKGRPKELKRTFDELESHNQLNQKAGDEEQEGEKREQESELTGKTVVFKWDDKKSEYAIAFADDKGDTELLSDLSEDIDFRAFLPAEDAKVDATWDIDVKEANVILFPGGDLKLQAKDDDDDDNGEVDRELRENAKGKVTATYKGTRDEGDKKVAVIEVKGEVKSTGDFESEESGTRAFDVTTEFSGEILWDVTANHVFSVTLEGKDTTTFTMTREIKAEEEEHKFVQKIELTGPITFKLTLGK